MKSILIFALMCVILCCESLPLQEAEGVKVEQDSLGNYKIFYKTKTSSRYEQRFHDGRVIGRYTYIDADNVEHVINYVAAPDQGFGAEGGDIPQQ